MRRSSACLLALALAACAPQPAPSQEALDAAAQRAEAAADLLSERLSGELVAAMSAGGPVPAISVCKERAPAIAAEIRESSGVEIGRTAFKVRNRANAPDAWELEIMRRFEQRHAAGEPWSAIREQRIDGAALRWMRPIPMGEICTACHGGADAISEDTRQALAAAYPSDQATGFEVGALRGAFTARVPLDNAAAP